MYKILLVIVILLILFSSIFSQSFFDIVSNGTPEEVQKAIDAGANVNDRTSDGTTTLMYAAYFNQNPEVVTILLKSGADGKLKDNEGKTAFYYAKDNENIKGTAAYWELNDAQYK